MIDSKTGSQQPNAYLEALPAWQRTLTEFVDDRHRIDFRSLAANLYDLDTFVAAIAEVSPMSHAYLFASHADRLSYHINAYNALAMRGIIERGIPANFNSLFKRASFFLFRSVTIGGHKTNLYHYENKVIRPMGDARVHFVLNCMVVDCPPIPKVAFRSNNLEQELQAATERFFEQEKYVQIDESQKCVRLTRLLKFYTKDYIGKQNKSALIDYVNQFRKDAIPSDYKLVFLPYDWTVNQVRT